MVKKTNMGNDEGSKQESTGDSLSSTSDIPKPIWVRHIGIQTDNINQRLLDYNARIICFCGPILWFILSII